MLYFYRTMFSSQSTHYPHNKRDVRVYIHVYYIYMYIIIYTVFPCLQCLARLKIALYILAHVPKSLLDPAVNVPVGYLTRCTLFFITLAPM